MPPSRDSPEELDQRDDGDRAFLESLLPENLISQLVSISFILERTPP